LFSAKMSNFAAVSCREQLNCFFHRKSPYILQHSPTTQGMYICI